MSDLGKGIAEIRRVREKIWEDIKDKTPQERAKYFHERGKVLCEKYGLEYCDQKEVNA